MSSNDAREEAAMAVLTALPTLEDRVVRCMEMCNFKLPETPDEVVRLHLMTTIRQECAEEITKIREDPDIKEFTDFHMAALADFLMDGIDLFDPDERAAMALSTDPS
jgi:hypothetical protein